MNYVLVFIGGGLGSSLRHTINVLCARFIGTAFPYGTFIINITGSTIMGLIAGYLAFKGEASQPWRLFLMTGILGGYTTFCHRSVCMADPARLSRFSLITRQTHSLVRTPSEGSGARR
jgi:protein CrcB